MTIFRAVLVSSFVCIALPSIAAVPVTNGKVIRGVTLPGPPGAPGTSTKMACNFSGEDVDMRGRMTTASVNCMPGGTTPRVVPGLPAQFNAYCVADASKLSSARIIPTPIFGNANHCDLSAIAPKDATARFGIAVWR